LSSAARALSTGIERSLTSTISPNCPLGTWTAWKEVLQCNEECGSCGSRILRRTCASECPCSGPSKIEERCNIQVCDYPKPSCCPPFKLMMMAGEFVCGPQEEAVAAGFIAKAKKNLTNISQLV
uniref:BOWMAN_BIRK domain-containing protein n=1 Tax=Nippostrongylus brasiliensis TaxID=27835 RepID=A0A0N4XGX3_NIPBR